MWLEFDAEVGGGGLFSHQMNKISFLVISCQYSAYSISDELKSNLKVI